MDTESLLRSLNAREVRYVVIGATAFPAHGLCVCETLDIDVFIEATPENVRRIAMVDRCRDRWWLTRSDVTVDDLLAKKLLIRRVRSENGRFTPLARVVDVRCRRNHVRRSHRPDAQSPFADLGRIRRPA